MTHRGSPNDYINYFLDLETVDIRSTSKMHGQKPRGQDEIIGILEMAVHRKDRGSGAMNPVHSATGYTDLIPQRVLAQYANKDIPDSFLHALSTHEGWGPGSRFSENLVGDPSGTLRRVLDAQIKAAATGKYPAAIGMDYDAKFNPTRRYLEGLADTWSKDQSQGKRVVANAWNASFDIPTLLENVYELGDEKLQRKFESIVGNKHLFEVKDLSDPVKQMMIDRIKDDPSYAPQHMNRAKINEALSSGVKTEDIVQSIKKGNSPYVARNEAIASFFRDVQSSQERKTGKSRVFADRLIETYKKHSTSGTLSRRDHREAIHEFSNRLTEVGSQSGDEMGAFRRVTAQLRGHKQFHFMDELLKKAYSSEGRTSIFGGGIAHLGPKPGLVSHMVTGMDMVSGWSLDRWSEMIEGGNQDGAHIAFADNIRAQQVSEHLAKERILSQASPASARTYHGMAASYIDRATTDTIVDKVRGMKPPGEGIQKGSPPITKAATDAAKNIPNPNKPGIRGQGGGGRSGIFLKSAAVLSGLYLMSDWNDDNDIDGIRRAVDRNDQQQAISPSGDILMNPFGSGRDALTQMVGAMQIGSVETVRSSMLGYRGEHLIHSLTGTKNYSYSSNPGLSERGELIHKMVEDMYMKSGRGQASEYFVYDPERDIVGHVDLILPSGVPLEVKSVEDYDALEKLQAPRDAHVSQANFYAHALGKPYAMLGYAARNDPSRIKYFIVPHDESRLDRDVEAVRATMAQLKSEGRSMRNYSVMQMVKDTMHEIQQPGLTHGTDPLQYFPGMTPSPQYHAMRTVGDYKKHNVRSRYRQERPKTNTVTCTGNSKVRNQGAKACTVPNHHHPKRTVNQSRALRYSQGVA